MTLHALDLVDARDAAETTLAERREDGSDWSLGMLRPLTPYAPGAHYYEAIFSSWEPAGDRFVRRDQHALHIWAVDAQSARRLAQQEIRSIDGYRPSWRIRQVTRVNAQNPQP